MTVQDQTWMRMALRKAEEGVALGQTPFGACLVKDGDIVACEHNRVWLDTDITAHAEIVAIREACRRLRQIDLSGCVLYSTTEPCPMCFSAAHWARVSRIVFGARIEDARHFGFHELEIANTDLRRLGRSEVAIEGDVLRDEAIEVFGTWRRRSDRRAY